MNLINFNSENFGQIQMIEFDGTVYFNPDVIARALEYKYTDSLFDAFSNIPKEDLEMYVKHFSFQELNSLRFQTGATEQSKWNSQGKRFLTEAGLFMLLNKTKKPNAYPFQKEVNTVILPEIRRTGGYNLEQQFDIPKTLPEALRLAAQLAEEKEALLEQVQKLKPKAAFRDYLVKSETWYDMKNVAKILFDKYEFKIGRNKLFEVLRTLKILMEDPNRNEPYQQFVTRGLFKINLHKLVENEINVVAKHTVVSTKGIEFIYRTLIKNNIPQDTDLVLEE